MTQHLTAIIGVAGPVTVALVAWLTNELSKRRADRYQRKEQRYAALVEALHGFYTNTEPTLAARLKQGFLVELNKCWLYCPDDVIQKAYEFLQTVHTDSKHADEVKEAALGEFMVAIRKDLIGRRLLGTTRLKAADFKHLRST